MQQQWFLAMSISFIPAEYSIERIITVTYNTAYLYKNRVSLIVIDEAIGIIERKIPVTHVYIETLSIHSMFATIKSGKC